MRFLRPLLFLALVWLTLLIFIEAQEEYRREKPDQSKLVLYFGSLVLVGGVAGVAFVKIVLPMLGDALGNVFFNPNQQIEKSPHADAVAAMARGDYQEAVHAYLKAFEANPRDTHALSEAAKIECEQLANPDAGASILEQALGRDWVPEEAAFLTSRLVDVYWKYGHKVREARALLLQIIETMPGTKHAANAQHKLQEIERQLATED